MENLVLKQIDSLNYELRFKDGRVLFLIKRVGTMWRAYDRFGKFLNLYSSYRYDLFEELKIEYKEGLHKFISNSDFYNQYVKPLEKI